MLRKFIRLLGYILLFVSLTIHGKTIQMTSTDWAPFYGSELEEDGVITALVRAAYGKVQHKTAIRFVPWKRAMQEAEIGTSDLVMGAYYSEERAKRFIFSYPFYEVKIGFIALQSLGLKRYSKLQDLTSYSIGTGRGWANTDTFDNANYLNKQEASNQILNVRKLFKKRVDMIVMAHGVFNYEYNRLLPSEKKKVIFLEPLLSRSPLYLMAHRAHPKSRQLIDDFNRGLGILMKSGEYKQIMKRFGFVATQPVGDIER